MQHNFLYTDPKAEYGTAWRVDVEEARREAQLPSCAKVLLLLCLATFILQAIAALLRHYVNPDGVTYLCTADFIADGKLVAGLSNFGVNTFIYMLVLFKQLGLDPFYAGMWWNVIMSTLVVLPLFGWVRRMFNLRIAIIASLLYAFHPIVLSIGATLMRGPMFWLFFNLVLYAAWRAITEVRLRWFFVAGCGLTLAIHTRSEAWFLVIPIVLWALGRFRFATGRRTRLFFGTLLLLAIVPGSITAMNLTVLKAYPQWGMFRPSHAHQLTTLYQKAEKKVKSIATEKKPTKDTVKKPSPQPSPQAPPTPPSFAVPGLRRALLRVVKSFSYLYGIYALIGLCVWRGRRRFALHAMFIMAVPILVLIWYRSCTSDVSPRYFLPIVFITFPIIALGLLWTARKIASLLGYRDEEEKNPSKKPIYYLAGMLALTFMVCCISANWEVSISEQKECELGKWTLKRFGPDQYVCCINRRSRMAAWYADTKSQHYLEYPVWGPNKRITSENRLAAIFQKAKPRVVLCWESHRKPKEMKGLFETLEEKNYYGYQVVEPDVLAEFEPKVIVLVRKDAN